MTLQKKKKKISMLRQMPVSQ